jgi:hypothetical protein
MRPSMRSGSTRHCCREHQHLRQDCARLPGVNPPSVCRGLLTNESGGVKGVT